MCSLDVGDGKRRVHDQVGRKFRDLEARILEAQTFLRLLGLIRTIEGRPETTYVTIRDVHGEKAHEASTILSDG